MGKEQGRSWRERFTPRPTQWEPFGAKEPNPQNQFQNDYHGPFANKMELNRSGAERFLRVGAVEDRVTLFALPSSWQNLLGEEGKLPVMVTFDRQGWQIGIGGQQIANELLDKRLSSEEIEKESIRRFNWFLRWGLLEVLAKENPPHLSLRNLWAASGIGLTFGLVTREFVPTMSIALIAWLWMGGNKLEFNRVVRGWAFLRWKEKNLVRETGREPLI